MLKDKRFEDYPLAWLFAFGPVLILPIVYWRQAWLLIGQRLYLGFFLGACFVLGFIGGTDTERIIFFAFPAVYGLLARLIGDNRQALARKPFFLTLLVLSQLRSSRVFTLLPNVNADLPHRYPILNPWGTAFPRMDLFTFFADRDVVIACMWQYLLLMTVLLAMFTFEIGSEREERRDVAPSGKAHGPVP